MHAFVHCDQLAFCCGDAVGMSTSFSQSPDEEPLLEHSSPLNSRTLSYRSLPTSDSTPGAEESSHHNLPLERSVEHDVIPEAATVGRNLGWTSAYILIISRVIGSGIFATPGAIVRSVGSVGITLVLWIVGAIVSWFGLAVTLEYGCMLPRSGGKHS